MEKFWILILVSFIATNSPEKAESVQLEELPLQTFDELFVEEWLDKDEAEDLKTPAPTNFGQNVHHQIDRPNTQLGQIEPYSTDQNPPLTESDHTRQIEPNSTDQNAPLTEMLLSLSLITLDKLTPIQRIRMLLSLSLITLDKLNPIQLIRMLLSLSLITLDKLSPI
uniref:Uncharacterized protein n=1 Tax=Globodera rostochiensis TaxID=31243 RepID=A0A914HUJ7_GLORO